MNRRTNLLYTSGDDSNFVTFSNYTEHLTGNFLATDYKLFPSRFLCLYSPKLETGLIGDNIESIDKYVTDFEGFGHVMYRTNMNDYKDDHEEYGVDDTQLYVCVAKVKWNNKEYYKWIRWSNYLDNWVYKISHDQNYENEGWEEAHIIILTPKYDYSEISLDNPLYFSDIIVVNNDNKEYVDPNQDTDFFGNPALVKYDTINWFDSNSNYPFDMMNLKSSKEELIQNYLVGHYENKLAFLRDMIAIPDNELLYLPYLIESLVKFDPDIDLKQIYCSEVVEQNYNGTFTDIICTIDSSDSSYWQINYESKTDKVRKPYSYSYSYLYNWYNMKDGPNANTFTRIWLKYDDNEPQYSDYWQHEGHYTVINNVNYVFLERYVDSGNGKFVKYGLNNSNEIGECRLLIEKTEFETILKNSGPIGYEIKQYAFISKDNTQYIFSNKISIYNYTEFFFSEEESKKQNTEIFIGPSLYKDVKPIIDYVDTELTTEDKNIGARLYHLKHDSTNNEVNIGNTFEESDIDFGEWFVYIGTVRIGSDIWYKWEKYNYGEADGTKYNDESSIGFVSGIVILTKQNSFTDLSITNYLSDYIICSEDMTIYENHNDWIFVKYVSIENIGEEIDSILSLPESVINQTIDKYYYNVNSNYINMSKNEGNIDVKFNMLIPLYDINNMNYATNKVMLDDVNVIEFTTPQTNDCVVNVPYGIWFPQETITLKRDSQTNYAPSWSLLIGTQFKPFPSSSYLQSDINDQSLGKSFQTFAQLLNLQKNVSEQLDKYNEIIASVSKKVDDMKVSMSTICDLTKLNVLIADLEKIRESFIGSEDSNEIPVVSTGNLQQWIYKAN